MRHALVLGVLLICAVAHAQTVSDLDPHLQAIVTASPPSLRLQWTALVNCSGIDVARRVPPDKTWKSVATLAANVTEWTDTTIAVGTKVEYRVTKNASSGVTGYAWLLGGIEVPFDDKPRRALVVVDTDTSTALATKLQRLLDDLTAEGWDAALATVDKAALPAAVKSVIQKDSSDHQTAAVFLVGAVPRAFSGCINPDGHPDHLRAWPADGYYADLDGNWTDTQAVCPTSTPPNVAGDGQFDQSSFPSPLDVAVGRLDATDMPAFAPLTATDLTGRYLDRDHDYRAGITAIKGRGFISDGFGYFSGEAFARVAWRDCSSIFGTLPDSGQPYFTALESADGYTFALGDGGGNPQGAGGVGSTSDFVTRTPKAVFVGLFGSYFGDWSYQNDFLRASLLSPGTGLTTMWFDRPYAHLHSLGALQTFGEAFVASANSSMSYGMDYDTGYGAGYVHQALLGDPTLRIFVTRPPAGLTATPSLTGIGLAWSASPDADQGYHVYRGQTRLTPTPIATTSYDDGAAPEGALSSYRVVAVQHLTTGSGTFLNHSPGAMAQATRPVSPQDAGMPPDANAPGLDAATPPDATAAIPPDATTQVPPDAATQSPPDATVAEPPDAAEPIPPDSGSGLDATQIAQEDSGAGEDAASEAPDATELLDASQIVAAKDAAQPGPDAAAAYESVKSGCGCGAAGSPIAPWFALLALVGVRPRRVKR